MNKVLSYFPCSQEGVDIMISHLETIRVQGTIKKE